MNMQNIKTYYTCYKPILKKACIRYTWGYTYVLVSKALHHSNTSLTENNSELYRLPERFLNFNPSYVNAKNTVDGWILGRKRLELRLSRDSKHDTSTQCLTNVGPLSMTLAQHWSNIGRMCRVCWDMYVTR